MAEAMMQAGGNTTPLILSVSSKSTDTNYHRQYSTSVTNSEDGKKSIVTCGNGSYGETLSWSITVGSASKCAVSGTTSAFSYSIPSTLSKGSVITVKAKGSNEGKELTLTLSK